MEPRTQFAWHGAREAQDRLAAANERAWLEHLAALTIEEAVRTLEDLSEGIPEFDEERPPLGHPVALFSIWRA